MRLRSYAVCMQIRRTKYGFISSDSDECLALNVEFDFDQFMSSLKTTTNLAHEFIRNIDKTILIGHTRKEEHEIRKQTY